MGHWNSMCMLDGAPGLFGSPGDFDGISHEIVGIRTVPAIHAFQAIQVMQPAAVKYEVIAAAYLGSTVDRKTDGLVGCYEQIRQQERNQAKINERCCQCHEEP